MAFRNSMDLRDLKRVENWQLSKIYTQNISQPYSPERNVNDKRDLYLIYCITMIGEVFYGGLHSKTRPPKYKFFEEKHTDFYGSPLYNLIWHNSGVICF